jgi:hypothetical protein
MNSDLKDLAKEFTPEEVTEFINSDIGQKACRHLMALTVAYETDMETAYWDTMLVDILEIGENG